MIRNALRGLGRRIVRHELVGRDAAGNEYLRKQGLKDDGTMMERRWVAFPSHLGSQFYDASLVPPEWHQWLNHRRHEPPSEELVLKAEAAREAVRQKVAALDDSEVGQRLRAQAYGVHAASASFPHEIPAREATESEESDHTGGSDSKQEQPEQPPPADQELVWKPPQH